MTPDFSRAVDPIFLIALDLVKRIENKERVITHDERATLIRTIEEAEAKLGMSPNWKLAKYAICSWIDESLIKSDWSDAMWWKEYCLEKRFFDTTTAHETFFTQAQHASDLSSKDALEVYYIAVVFGFRCTSSNSDTLYAREFLGNLKAPDTIESWCRDVARSLHLKHDRPPIPAQALIQGNRNPLDGRSNLMAYSMLSMVMLAAAILCYIFMHHDFREKRKPNETNKVEGTK
jgi:type VI secretion system protein ImpK